MNTTNARQRAQNRAWRGRYKEAHVSLPRSKFGPDIPWAPLERQFAVRGMNPNKHISEKAVFRYRQAGTLQFSSADFICCEVFKIHPFDVYGFDWYTFDPETP